MMMRDKFDIVAENYADDYKELAKEIYKAGLKRGRSKAKKITWIPCSERLPDKEGEYLVSLNNDPICIAPFNVEANGFGFWDEEFDYDNELIGCKWFEIDVVAWMPLPQPYRGDGNG